MARVAAEFVEQDVAVLIDNALRVFARADEAEERIEEPRGPQGDLTVVFVGVLTFSGER